ncbi:hypothetical protein KP509_03G060400 [Ceratopteris richardii]|nr:hypothetical protein KP509_03G060400 [Ceratopteris richardii]
MISKVEQEVLVCNPVLIIFKGGMDGKVLNLPWNRKSVQEFQLEAVGGCGSQSTDYRWLSMDTMIASINSQGLIHAKGLGSVVIRAFALTNPKNVDEIKLKTSCPSSIVKIEDFPVEAEVGSYLPVAVTMRTAEGLLYSKCDSFTSLFDWRITDGGIFIETDETINDTFKKNIHGQEVFNHICDMKQFLAVKPGRVTLTASLVIDDSCMLPGSLSHNELSVSWAISAYAPLVVVQAGDGGSHGGYNCETNHMENSGLRQFMNQCQINVLSLVPGSSMRIMLKGGPEPWGSGVEFIERHEVSTNLEEKGMDAPVVTDYAGSEGRIYEIMCRSFGNYTVTFYRGNSIAADNPHPKTEMKSLLIVCDLPSSIALLVDSESSLENIKVAAHSLHDQNHVHQSPVTVVSGRTLRVAAVALDGNSIPFANASSLSVDWMLVDCLGLVHWQGRSLSEAFIDNGRWEEFIILKEDSGQCLLKATVRMLREESWLLSAINLQSFGSAVHGKHILTDAVQLQLVASLRVSPKSLLLYNHLNAKGLLTVIGGSSHVEAFSNDSKVALVLERSASQQSLQVAVAARGLGAALVTVRDVGLISPSEDSALVLVAEVGWVHLLIPEDGSIQVGSFLEIHVQAGDKAGNIFSDSQLELMDIQLNVKDEILEVLQKKGLGTHTESKVSASLIVMRGVSVGVTDIYVSVSSRTGHDVVSEMRKIEVYEPLSLHPEGLVLAPGTQSVVWVDGGPTIGVFKRFGSSNQTVVSVHGLVGMLEANFPGNTSITVQMVTQGGRVVCSAMMDVFVQVPVSMHLNIKGGQLAVGRQMSVFPVGSQEDLFSFYQLCTSYKWTVEDPQVLTLLMPEDSEETNAIDSWTSSASSHSTPKSVSAAFSTVVFGRSSGKTDIAVEFSCHFKSKGGFSSLQSYTAASAIQIVPDPPLALGMAATWLLPPNYISSSLLPQSSETMDISMHGKRSISYTLLQSCKDSARIYLDGTHIRTTEINDMACVKARDRRTGRSEIAVCVRVAEVGKVFVGPSLSSSRKFEISVGAHAVYSIVAQDEIGIAFYEVGDAVDFLAETDRSDVVSVTVLNKDADDLSRNISLHVQALKQGTAMIRLSQVGNTDIVDYLLVDVGASILPRNPVIHVGGHVNFSLAGKGLVSNENAFWWSSNPDVLLVNRQTGEGFAVAPGLSSVTYNSSHVTAYTVVKVIEISSVILKAPKGLLTNVGVPEKGYLFAVKFSDPRGQDVGVVSNEERVSYSCHVDPAYLGLCSGWQDPDDLKTYCVFRPYSPTRLFLTLQGVGKDPGSSLVLGDFKGCTTVKILAEVTGMGETGSAMSAFAGGFEMQDVPQKIYLNPVTNKTKVTLVGSAGAVGVSWTKTEALGIKRISSEREAFGFAGHAIFEVRVIDGGEPFKSTILFHLPTTGQTEEIQVEYDVKEQNKRTLFQQVITAAIVIAVIGILPFLACARIMDLPRRHSGGHVTTDANRSYRPLSQASPGSPASPVENLYSSNFDGQQSVSLSRSPPQPYSDYVSKTIDSTPYFRREGVRRFDPTRTY